MGAVLVLLVIYLLLSDRWGGPDDKDNDRR